MITITEFTATQLRAAKALLSGLESIDDAAKPAPAEAAPAAASDAPAEAAAHDDAEADAAPASESPSDAIASDAAEHEEAEASEAAAPDGEAAPAPEGNAPPAADAADAHAVAALVERFGFDEKKARHLLDSVTVAGNRIDRLRSVRVVQLEGAPRAAVKHGEFGYIVDMLQSRGRGAPDRKGGRGGKGGRRGPRGGDGMGGVPGASGNKSKNDPNDLSGPFSMDAVREDRKREALAERRARPGGRRPPGRGGARGGRPGGGPGGGPRPTGTPGGGAGRR